MCLLMGYPFVSLCAKEIAPAPNNAQPTTETASGANGDKIRVSKVQVLNAQHLATEDISAIVAPFENRELDFAQMQAITTLLTQAYRQKGYPVASAFIPNQNVHAQDGDLTIQVVEGTFGQVHLTNSSLNKTPWVQARLDGLQGAVVSNAALERTMLLLNDTPGTVVSAANIKAGATLGSSDLDMTLQASNRLSAYAQADNQGSIYTGKQRLSAGIAVNAPLGYGDKLTLDAMTSEAGGLLNGRIAYAIPLNPQGLQSELAAGKTTYALGGEFSGLDAVGQSNSVDVSLSYPIQKSIRQTVGVRLTFSSRQMQDEIRVVGMSTSKSAQSAALMLAATRDEPWLGLSGQTRMELGYTQGHLKLEDSALANDQADGGAHTNGDYAKLTASLSRFTQLSKQLSCQAWIKTQQALMNKNLDGSEDFAVSGAHGVKAYAPGELSAENGYLVGVELGYALLPFNGMDWSLSAFADHGRAVMQNRMAGFDAKSLSDVGAGLSVRYKAFYSRLQIAWAVGQEPISEGTSRTKALWQMGAAF